MGSPLPPEPMQEAWSGNLLLGDEQASCVWDDGCDWDFLGHMVKRILLHFEDNAQVDEDCVVGDEDELRDGMDHDDDMGVQSMGSLDHNNFVCLASLDVSESDDWRGVVLQ